MMAVKSSALRTMSCARRLALTCASVAAFGMAMTVGSLSAQASATWNGVAQWRAPIAERTGEGGNRPCPMGLQAMAAMWCLAQLRQQVELVAALGHIGEDLVGGAGFAAGAGQLLHVAVIEVADPQRRIFPAWIRLPSPLVPASGCEPRQCSRYRSRWSVFRRCSWPRPRVRSGHGLRSRDRPC